MKILEHIGTIQTEASTTNDTLYVFKVNQSNKFILINSAVTTVAWEYTYENKINIGTYIDNAYRDVYKDSLSESTGIFKLDIDMDISIDDMISNIMSIILDHYNREQNLKLILD